MIFAVAFAFTAPLFLGALANWADMPGVIRGLGEPSAAAWAQAIGAIIAVCAAWMVGNRQAEAARTAAEKAVQAQLARDHEARYAARLAAYNLMKLTADRIAMFKLALEGEKPEKSWFDSLALMLAGAEKMVAGFPIHQIIDPVSMDLFLKAVSVVELARMVVDRTARNTSMDSTELEQTRLDLIKDFENWERTLRKLCKLYKTKLVFHYTTPLLPH